MDLVLAMDLKGGLVVHGKRGERSTYRPLTWGLSPTAEPVAYLSIMRPRSLYIADLDRITGGGSHDQEIFSCARMVSTCYVDRGCSSPEDYLEGENIMNVVGTETAGEDLTRYPSSILSLDIRNGRVIPGNRMPSQVLREVEDLSFHGYLILNLGAVGTRKGLQSAELSLFRAATAKPLLFGGGIAGAPDLDLLASAGFDGAVVATAVHTGQIPIDTVRRGVWC